VIVERRASVLIDARGELPATGEQARPYSFGAAAQIASPGAAAVQRRRLWIWADLDRYPKAYGNSVPVLGVEILSRQMLTTNN
jgi:hypothetical protein